MCDDHAMESGASKRSEVRFLVFSASLREASLNTRLAELAATTIEADGGTVERASMAQFDCPTARTRKHARASRRARRSCTGACRRATRLWPSRGQPRRRTACARGLASGVR